VILPPLVFPGQTLQLIYQKVQIKQNQVFITFALEGTPSLVLSAALQVSKLELPNLRRAEQMLFQQKSGYPQSCSYSGILGRTTDNLRGQSYRELFIGG